ncbi:MAG: ribose 5-phosphate isomerase A [Treponema sp.]|jgi:ribose 5-phosphate isomerase A|nr:ribose 5-phosphate isomerase A [Treponema sp.]
MEQSEIKALTGKAVVEAQVKSGMKLGLGTGSTAIHAVYHVGTLLKQGALRNIHVVPTSFQTMIACEELGIPLYSLNSPEIAGRLDLTIDGADEVDNENLCVKGGGGALLLEKIVAYSSDAYAIVIDESKRVEHLGLRFPVPLEIIAEARIPICQSLERLGAVVTLRSAVGKAGPIITEHGNLLLDIRFKTPVDPRAFEERLKLIAGVVENGFFTKMRPTIFIGRSNGCVEVKS